MTDTPATDAPAASDAQAQAATTNQPSAVEATPHITPEVQALIDAAATKASQSANREAAGLRSKLKGFEDADQARKDADLTATELLTKQLAAANEAAKQAQSHAQAAALRAEVATIGKQFVDTDAALQLMDRSGVSFGENGAPVGVQEALNALAEKSPWLVAKPGTPTLPTSNGQRKDGDKAAPSDAERLAALRGQSGGSNIWQ